MAALDNVVATDKKAAAMRGKGRNGDTEMAHVTPGEKIVPLSLQTPRVNKVLNEEFARAGVPLERYTVGTSKNSINPETGEDEYFLKGIKRAVKKVIKAAPSIAAGFATGGPGGALLAAGGALMSPSGNKLNAQGGEAAATGNPVIDSAAGATRQSADGGERFPSFGKNRDNLEMAAPENPFDNVTAGGGRVGGGSRGTDINPSFDGGGGGIEEAVAMLIENVLPSRNPSTGVQEFYDVPNRMNKGTPMMRTPQNRTVRPAGVRGSSAASRNPRTGYQEFADPINPLLAGKGVGSNSPWASLANAGAAKTMPSAAPAAAPAPSGGFDSASYYAANPDVKAAGMDAQTHYNKYGVKEGRSLGTVTPTPAPAAATPAAPALSAVGLAPADNQAAKRRAGYTGTFGDVNDWQKFARDNPTNYLDYVTDAASKNPNFTPNVDFDLVTPGVQTWNKDLKVAAANKLTGYTGTHGTGGFGSGEKGIDFLSLPQNAGYQQQWTNLRKIFEPSYTYTMKDVLPSDFNEAEYLKMNPQAAAGINAGQYNTAGHHYNTVGKAAGLNYLGQKEEGVSPEMQALLDRISALEGGSQTNTTATNTNAADNNAAMSMPSTLSPVRVPRFRSRRYRGTMASNF